MGSIERVFNILFLIAAIQLSSHIVNKRRDRGGWLPLLSREERTPGWAAVPTIRPVNSTLLAASGFIFKSEVIYRQDGNNFIINSQFKRK